MKYGVDISDIEMKYIAVVTWEILIYMNILEYYKF
jgi:hypothetical protein